MNSDDARRPVLSICVPTYNRAHYLACLLEDLAANMSNLGLSYELLIGDNCSEDSTSKVVEKYLGLLNIRYFRRPQNIGGQANLASLYRAAKGKYALYLADDDLLILESLRELIQIMDANPDIGVAFAPWLVFDRIAGKDVTQFYSIETDIRIGQRDYASLLVLLVNRHIFPEIYVAKTDLVQSMTVPDSRIAFLFFTQIIFLLNRSAIFFSTRPFYRSVSRYFEKESRKQQGIEQVKDYWDSYRGGLECILATFAKQLSADDLAKCRQGIDWFTAIRMQVGLRIRTAEGKQWVENYYLANRLRSMGRDDMLPAPYDLYRVNAAFEHLLGMTPFIPQQTVFAYFADDPPIILAGAQGFASAPLLVLPDRSIPVPENTVLVTSTCARGGVVGVVSYSELELLDLFP